MSRDLKKKTVVVFYIQYVRWTAVPRLKGQEAGDLCIAEGNNGGKGAKVQAQTAVTRTGQHLKSAKNKPMC